jgi:hypothetical protein
MCMGKIASTYNAMNAWNVDWRSGRTRIRSPTILECDVPLLLLVLVVGVNGVVVVVVVVVVDGDDDDGAGVVEPIRIATRNDRP